MQTVKCSVFENGFEDVYCMRTIKRIPDSSCQSINPGFLPDLPNAPMVGIRDPKLCKIHANDGGISLAWPENTVDRSDVRLSWLPGKRCLILFGCREQASNPNPVRKQVSGAGARVPQAGTTRTPGKKIANVAVIPLRGEK